MIHPDSDHLTVCDGLAARTIGDGERSVLWLHGFMGSSADFVSCANSLAATHRSLLPDLPGHGSSAILEHNSFQSWGDLIIRFLDASAIAVTDIVGYSLGGRLALHLVLTYPDRFGRAVIESGSPGIRGATERHVRQSLDVERASAIESDFDRFLEMWYRSSVFSSLRARPDLTRLLIEARRKNDKMALARVVAELSPGIQPSLWRKLPALGVRTSFIAGAQDGKYVAIAQRAAACSREITATIIGNAGHNVHLEAEEAYLDAVRSFLNS